MAGKERPEFCTDEMLVFLDDLRESGETNMFGAGRYIDEEYPELADGDVRSYRSSARAGKVLSYWMDSFAERHGLAGSHKVGEEPRSV